MAGYKLHQIPEFPKSQRISITHDLENQLFLKFFIIKTAITNKIETIFTAITNNITMKKTNLGEFEEMVLLSVIVLKENAYGVEIKKELENRLSERLSVGSIQSALKRMEEKGFLESEFGEATQKRGGKRKRIYTATMHAHQVLNEIKQIREGFWQDISIEKGLKTI